MTLDMVATASAMAAFRHYLASADSTRALPSNISSTFPISRSLVSPRSLYSRLALAEVITWTLLLAGIIAKRVFGLEWATMVSGSLHGFVFLSYCVATVAVWIDKRWNARTGLLGLASSVLPYSTIPFERWVERRGLLDSSWRLTPDSSAGAQPQNSSGTATWNTPPEALLALALRRPLTSLAVAIVSVAAVFSLLLWAGPPTEW